MLARPGLHAASDDEAAAAPESDVPRAWAPAPPASPHTNAEHPQVTHSSDEHVTATHVGAVAQQQLVPGLDVRRGHHLQLKVAELQPVRLAGGGGAAALAAALAAAPPARCLLLRRRRLAAGGKALGGARRGGGGGRARRPLVQHPPARTRRGGDAPGALTGFL